MADFAFRKGFESTFGKGMDIGSKAAQTSIEENIKKQAEKAKKEAEKLKAQTDYEKVLRVVGSKNPDLAQQLAGLDVTDIGNENLNKITGVLINQMKPESEADKFIEQGKIADAAIKMTEAGMGGRIPASIQQLQGGQQIAQPSMDSQILQTAGRQVASQQGQPLQNAQPTQSDAFSTESNVMGVPTKIFSEEGLKRKQQIEAEGKILEAKNKVETESLLNSLQTSDASKPFFGTYQLALAEVRDEFGENIDKSTLLGAGIRTVAKMKEAFGLLPETSAFRKQIEAFATPIAKAAGEDRLTNEDIQRFTRLIPDVLGASTKENINKIRNFVLTLEFRSGTDDATKDRIRNNFVQSFRMAGGPLAEAANKIESFESDVKAAGKSIESGNKGKLSSGITFEVL